MRTAARVLLAALFCFASVANPAAADEPVVDRLFLIGDAGARDERDQVLKALHADVAESFQTMGKAHVAVIFLGDNVYPEGVPDEENTPAFRSAAIRLVAQVKSAEVNDDVAVYFVPGNHDWDRQGRRGLARVRRETRELAKFGDNVQMLPGNGCPGPEVCQLGARLQILFLDTQWWLHKFEKPSDCAIGTREGVTAAIAAALQNAGERFTIVAAHHPLISGGPHGSHFFPFASEQDQHHAANEAMRTAITNSFGATRPLAWVSGHEHTLEVLRGEKTSYLLVSGAGNFNHTSTTVPDARRGTWLFPPARWQPRGGYMRLDFRASGAPELSVVTVDQNANRAIAFTLTLN